MARTAFDWDSYNKTKDKAWTILHEKGIEIEYKDVFRKGFKALMGTVKAAKLNQQKFEQVVNGDYAYKTITLYRF